MYHDAELNMNDHELLDSSSIYVTAVAILRFGAFDALLELLMKLHLIFHLLVKEYNSLTINELTSLQLNFIYQNTHS
jgi:hypothetical protein